MWTQLLLGQLIVGLMNGSFYALLALGFAIIFGLTLVQFRATRSRVVYAD